MNTSNTFGKEDNLDSRQMKFSYYHLKSATTFMHYPLNFSVKSQAEVKNWAIKLANPSKTIIEWNPALSQDSFPFCFCITMYTIQGSA